MEIFNIDKNSWHYKLVKEHVTEKYPFDLHREMMPKDFCSYWRRVVLESVKWFFLISFAIALIILIFVAIVTLFYAIFFDFGNGGIVILSMIFAFVLTLSSFLLPDYMRKRKINKFKNGESSEETQNIFVARYKAWKQKICPGIKYKE